jgi:putative ABC transport system ATP-binding protein
MSDTHSVICKKVTKVFGDAETRVEALRGINFEAAFGKLTFIAGPSGSGKTTLLSVITGLLDETNGELIVLGEHIHNQSAAQKIKFRRKSIGFVFQQYSLMPSLTAIENAAVPLLAGGTRWEKAMEASAEALTYLGLSKRMYAHPRELSGGEQQRVAIARAIAHKPRLIVCDEPTSALDGKTGHAVMELLSKKALGPDRSIIVVTHDERIFSFADSIAHVLDGVITHVEFPKHSS